MTRRPVVFDCDGVLVDSEALSWEAWRAAVTPFGLRITEDDEQRLTGMSAAGVAAALANGSADHRDILAAVAREAERVLSTRLEAFEDAEDVVHHLFRLGTPLAVATSSTRARLDLSLTVTELDGYFAATVAGDEVAVAKPSPDLYLEAAARLGVEPSECVAVEDAPNGIEAARSAGMLVVAVERGQFAPSDLAAADIVVPTLTPAVFLT